MSKGTWSFTFTSRVKDVQTELATKVDKALEEIGGKCETYAKKLCPVDTGHLRNSITHQRATDNVAEEAAELVGSNVEYAPYVELGTYKMDAKPYLRPAVEDHQGEYHDIVERIMKG